MGMGHTITTQTATCYAVICMDGGVSHVLVRTDNVAPESLHH